MVLLEASRLEDQGDMAGAWGWYRAMVRTIHHVSMRGSVQRRSSVQNWHAQLGDTAGDVGRRPEDDARTASPALSDVVACEALAPSERDSLKASYLAVNLLLDSPKNLASKVPMKRFRQLWNPGYPLTRGEMQGSGMHGDSGAASLHAAGGSSGW